MRLILVPILSSILLFGCRTTKDEDQRRFAEVDISKGAKGTTIDVIAQPSHPGTPQPSLIPSPADITAGGFHRLCEARDQLPEPQELTIRALLAATHQQTCAAAEKFLQDKRNQSLLIESEELIELEMLAVLKAYLNIQEIWIRTAKGVEHNCPLRSNQICHFRDPDYYP